jgi:hypothetical protein
MTELLLVTAIYDSTGVGRTGAGVFSRLSSTTLMCRFFSSIMLSMDRFASCRLEYVPTIIMRTPTTSTNWAASRSVVFFVVSLMNMSAGKMMQMADPMVEPTMPRTNSMSGMRMPRVRVMRITMTVMTLNRAGGM